MKTVDKHFFHFAAVPEMGFADVDFYALKYWQKQKKIAAFESIKAIVKEFSDKLYPFWRAFHRQASTHVTARLLTVISFTIVFIEVHSINAEWMTDNKGWKHQ